MEAFKIPKKVPRVRGDDGHHTITIRMPVSILEQIEVLASETGRSRNQIINMLLSAALKNASVEEES